MSMLGGMSHAPYAPAPGATSPAGTSPTGVALLLLLLTSGFFVTAKPSRTQPAPGGTLSDALRDRIEGGREIGRITAAQDPIMASTALPRFYEARGFRPAWLAGSKVTAPAEELLRALRQAPDQGLRGEDYHLLEIESLLRESRDNPDAELLRRVDAELLLTDAFLVYASHLHQGRVNPNSVQPEWLANRRNADYATLLEEALGARKGIEGTLADLLPHYEAYRGLQRFLRRLRSVQGSGGWLPIPEGGALRRGDQGPRVAALRRRLQESGDLPTAQSPSEEGAAGRNPASSDPSPDSRSDLFEEGLEAATLGFQRRHGLDADGVVGQATLAALNTPLEERIGKLEANLERWRWLPDDLGRRHIRVNIAGFSVEVWEDRKLILTLRAVVGREYRQTPSFTGRMTYLVLAPAWHVPPEIAVKDKLPQIKENPAYLEAQKMTLLDSSTNQAVDPAMVDWTRVTATDFNRRFRLRQSPGPHNALGLVKFMFPNQFHVYLHDTPQRELFERSERSFSSGCIRIDRPMELAAYLLRDDPGWTRERLEAVAARESETAVKLREPVPVHLLYWTAWVDNSGALQFRRDLYGRDSRLLRALAGAAPGL